MKRCLAIVLLSALLVSLSAFPAMAESAAQQQGEYTRVEFVDVPEGTTYEAGIPTEELTVDYGIVAADEDDYDILSEWGDIRGRAVLIRQRPV